MIRITAESNSARRLSSRARIWAWIVTSSAVVGSSAITMSGLQERASAIMTRWRMPPDSSCGYVSIRSVAFGMPTCFSRSIARRLACFFEIDSCATIASTIWTPIRYTGFSDVIGSWKIIAISSPRTSRRRDSGMVSRFCPL